MDKKCVFDYNNIHLADDHEFDDIPPEEEIDYEFSKKFRQRMSRIFREQSGSERPLHPEADNTFERLRSNIYRQLYLMKKRKKISHETAEKECRFR